jgi:hypothetical protein
MPYQKHDISNRVRAMLMCSAVVQAVTFFAILSSIYTFAIAGIDVNTGAALWYEIPSVGSTVFCLCIFVRDIRWNEWVILVYGILEGIKIGADVFVLAVWYTDAAPNTPGPIVSPAVIDRHTVWLMCLLGMSLLLSIANVTVLYGAYRHWCTSQKKLHEEEQLPTTFVDAAPDVIVIDSAPPPPMEQGNRRKKRTREAHRHERPTTMRDFHDEQPINLLEHINQTRAAVYTQPHSTMPIHSPSSPVPKSNAYEEQLAYFS